MLEHAMSQAAFEIPESYEELCVLLCIDPEGCIKRCCPENGEWLVCLAQRTG